MGKPYSTDLRELRRRLRIVLFWELLYRQSAGQSLRARTIDRLFPLRESVTCTSPPCHDRLSPSANLQNLQHTTPAGGTLLPHESANDRSTDVGRRAPPWQRLRTGRAAPEPVAPSSLKSPCENSLSHRFVQERSTKRHNVLGESFRVVRMGAWTPWQLAQLRGRAALLGERLSESVIAGGPNGCDKTRTEQRLRGGISLESELGGGPRNLRNVERLACGSLHSPSEDKEFPLACVRAAIQRPSLDVCRAG